MTWGRTSNPAEHKARSVALTSAYDSRGRSGSELMRRVAEGGGSRGGAPIWVMKEALMAVRRERACSCPDPMCLRHGFDNTSSGAADPDGNAVFGRYPKGFLTHVLRLHLLGDIHREDILHVCSGTLTERWTVDIRPEARPRVQASGTALPFRDGSFAAVMMDPPYSDEYAKNLYGVVNPRPSWLLKEAARVLRPGGRIGILHVAVPFSPPACRLVNVYGVSTGVGFRIRALTVYEREQAGLAFSVSALASAEPCEDASV